MKQHKNLSHKQEDLLSVYRVQSATPEVVNAYFEVLLKTYNDLGVSQSYRVWNVDETGVMTIPKTKKVIGEVGKPARSLVPSERGELSTVITLVNAASDVIPPFVIHKGLCVQKNWLRGKPEGWVVHASTNAYINKEIFVQVGEKFLHGLGYLNTLHVLLMDNHFSHLFNYCFLKTMADYNVHVIGIPAHTSHILQPLDNLPF